METWTSCNFLSALRFHFSKDQSQGFKVINSCSALYVIEMYCVYFKDKNSCHSNKGERRDNGTGIIQG